LQLGAKFNLNLILIELSILNALLLKLCLIGQDVRKVPNAHKKSS
jgi:hypothetical protein